MILVAQKRIGEDQNLVTRLEITISNVLKQKKVCPFEADLTFVDENINYFQLCLRL